MTASDSGTEEPQASGEERLALVEEHVQQENQHDLDGIMATFGEEAWYDNEPVGEHHDGRDSVRAYYEDLLQALPDFHIDIHQRHVTDDHVILETTQSGTHEGTLRGLPGMAGRSSSTRARCSRSTTRVNSRASASTTTVRGSPDSWASSTTLRRALGKS